MKATVRLQGRIQDWYDGKGILIYKGVWVRFADFSSLIFLKYPLEMK